MQTVAIGDVHGNLLALDDLLAKIVPELRSEDTLVFLGDYIDRGPDSRGCVERIIQLKLEADFSVVTLLGNHEQWMLKSLRDPTCHSWIVGMEAFDTIASYSADAAGVLRGALEHAGMSLITETVMLPYHVFFDAVPPNHLRFFQQLEVFHRTANVICVHAGIDLEGRLLSRDPEIFTWGLDGFPDEYRGDDSVVYGHWNNTVEDGNGWPRPAVGVNRTYGIDTIAKGVLTAMGFPDTRIVQSRRYLFANQRHELERNKGH